MGQRYFGDRGRDFQPVPFGDGQGAVYGVALGDLDGDSYPDVAMGRSNAPNVVYLSRPR
jgi:hypothetical protein